jgi:hypothetical protein
MSYSVTNYRTGPIELVENFPAARVPPWPRCLVGGSSRNRGPPRTESNVRLEVPLTLTHTQHPGAINHTYLADQVSLSTSTFFFFYSFLPVPFVLVYRESFRSLLHSPPSSVRHPSTQAYGDFVHQDVTMISPRADDDDDTVYTYISPWTVTNVGLWSLFAGATLFLALRVWCKVTRRHGLWYDDYILIFAWVSSERLIPQDLAMHPLVSRADRISNLLLLVVHIWRPD